MAWGVSLFLILTGATASQAYWTTPGAGITSSAAGGYVDSTLARSNSNTVTVPTSTRSGNMPFTLTNTGSLDANWRFSFTTNSSTASGTTFTVWALSPGETCDTAATPHDAKTATGSAPSALTGTFAKGASVQVCVRAVMTAAAQQNNQSAAIAINATLATSVSNWSGGGTASGSMAIVDDQAPSTPTVTLSRPSGYSTTLNWPASTDNTAVTGYRIYRDGTLIDTVNSGTTQYTSSGLQPGVGYTFAVEAFDAAGNAARSAPVTTTTFNIPSDSAYEIYVPFADKCVDVSGVNPNLGTPIHIWDCYRADNQTFYFRAQSDGSYILEPRFSPNTALGVTSNSVEEQLRLKEKGSYGTFWLVTPRGDGYVLINRDTGLHMDIYGAHSDNGTSVIQWPDNGNMNQSFRLIPN